MTGIDEIVRTIEIRAAQASDGVGLTGRIQARAARIKRRRRVTTAVAAAVVVLGAATAIPLTVRERADRDLPASTHFRDPGQLTVSPASKTAYTWRRGTHGGLQWMTPFQGTSKGATCCGSMVRVYDPGTYDSSELKKGERVQVSGHKAWYGSTHITAPTEPPEIDYEGTADFEVPTLGWQDKSGAWVTVIAYEDGPPQFASEPEKLKKQMFDVAADVRMGPPRDVRVPMHFPTIPEDLPISFAYADDQKFATGQQATLGFGGGTGIPLLYLGGSSKSGSGAPLEISAWTVSTSPWNQFANERDYQEVEVAGRPARYRDLEDGRGMLLVQVGTCGIQVLVENPNRITVADLDAMFTGATFDKCDSTATWTRPVN